MHSTRLKIFLEHPFDEWVRVGTLQSDRGSGRFSFTYSAQYLKLVSPVPLDPIGLPLSEAPIDCPRYAGLPDVLRDICPDAWGRRLLQCVIGLERGPTLWEALARGADAECWGAITVGAAPQKSFRASSVSLRSEICAELIALSRGAPALHPDIRRMILLTPSLGGARPKTTINDGGIAWIIKPQIPTDPLDLPLLEHLAMSIGSACGMHFAPTRYIPNLRCGSVIEVERFDRVRGHRRMVLSGATLLRVEFPVARESDRLMASYARLADALSSIGCPAEDLRELFVRAAYNLLVGNDDDHPRNHAAVYDVERAAWRLAPAFDVVPNPDGSTVSLAMRVGETADRPTVEEFLSSYARFGFLSAPDAYRCLCSMANQLCLALLSRHQFSDTREFKRLVSNVVIGLRHLNLWTDRHSGLLSHAL